MGELHVEKKKGVNENSHTSGTASHQRDQLRTKTHGLEYARERVGESKMSLAALDLVEPTILRSNDIY